MKNGDAIWKPIDIVKLKADIRAGRMFVAFKDNHILLGDCLSGEVVCLSEFEVYPAIHSFWIGLAPGPHPGIGHGICGHCHQRITLGDHKSRCPNCGAIMDQEAPENG